MRACVRGYLGKKCSLSSSLSARLMGLDGGCSWRRPRQTAGMDVSPPARGDEGDTALPFVAGGMHASPARVSRPNPPLMEPRRQQRSVLLGDLLPGGDEGKQAAGQRLHLSPCVGSASPVGRPQNLLVDVIDTPCLLP